MRTTLTVSDELSEQILELTHEKSLAAAVNKALEGYVRQQKLARVVGLFGKVKFEKGYDYKALRRKEAF